MLRSTETASSTLRGVAGRDVGALADVGADREEGGVEVAAVMALAGCSSTFVSSLSGHAEVRGCAATSASSTSRGRRYFGNAEAHHAAGDRPRLVDRHLVAEARAGGRRRTARRARRRPPARACPTRARAASNCQPRLIASSPRKRSTELMPTAASRLPAVAGALARVIADAAHDRRHRVVRRQRAPGRFVIAGFGVEQPALDVLARRAGVVARRQPVDIDRALVRQEPVRVGERRARRRA